MTDIHCFSFVEDGPSKEPLGKLVTQRNESCRRQLLFQERYPPERSKEMAAEDVAPVPDSVHRPRVQQKAE